ncbi:hypothetical protein [Cecembia sp.]|uniref:hypothetical protein n=1 Tax=Cecembia sp. TaxID=1898110 RepID=UPI0025BABCD6|nr:hypothetical protein [Cecembia sp.]
MKIKLVLFFWMISGPLMAQIKVVSEWDSNQNLNLIAYSQENIPYIIRLAFFDLENLESKDGDLVYAVAKKGKTQLIQFTKIYENEETRFRYDSKLYKGTFVSQDKVQYLIPLKEGHTCDIKPLVAAKSSQTNGREANEYAGVGFYFTSPTVICSPRKGVVTDLKMDIEVSEDNIEFTDKENFIEIFHEDGTFTRLSVLQPGSQKVNIGDPVLSGQELAISEGENYQKGRHVKMIQSGWKLEHGEITWINFPVELVAEQKELISNVEVQGVSVIHPLENITSEMTKKESKKYLKERTVN